VERSKGKSIGELEVGLGRKDAYVHGPARLVNRRYVLPLFLISALVSLYDAVGELYRRLNFLLFQPFPHFLGIDTLRIIPKSVGILPSASFDDLEGHLFGQRLPIVDIAAGINTSHCDIGAQLHASEDVDTVVILDGSFCEKTIVLKMILYVDADYCP
jgi:hypothetical protein